MAQAVATETSRRQEDDGREGRSASLFLVGGRGVGKTSLLRRFLYDSHPDRATTVRRTRRSIRSRRMNGPNLDSTPLGRIAVRSLSGTSETAARSIFDASRWGEVGVLAICDIAQATSVGVIRPYLVEICGFARRIPVVLVCNKADLDHNTGPPQKELRELAAEHEIPLTFVSARTGLRVEDTFQLLCDLMVRQSREDRLQETFRFLRPLMGHLGGRD